MRRLLVALLTTFAAVAGADTNTFHFRGATVRATYEAEQRDGACTIRSSWNVTAFSRSSHSTDPNAADEEPVLDFQILRLRVCPDGETVLFSPLAVIIGRVPVPESAIDVGPRLDWATVRASVDAFDRSSVPPTPVTLDFQITATATLPAVQNTRLLRRLLDGFRTVIRERGSFREATAVVSVIDATGTQYTPETPDSAEISTLVTGAVTITRP